MATTIHFPLLRLSDSEQAMLPWPSWPMVVLRFVLVVLLRAFLLLAMWNELIWPLLPGMPAVVIGQLAPLPAILVALLITVGGFDRPILRPIHKILAE